MTGAIGNLMNVVVPLVACLATCGVDAAVLRASSLQHSLRHESDAANTTMHERELSLVQVGKPIRINRGGSGTSPDKVSKTDAVSKAGCGHTVKVHSESAKHERCPDDCPFYAQDRTDSDFCTFACVEAPQCVKMNPATQIGDEELGVCRSCVVDGCSVCDTSVTHDACSECQIGYYLKEDGLCYFKYGGKWVDVVKGIIAAIVALLVLWLIEWGFRGTSNEIGLNHGLKQRENTKLKMKKDASGERQQFPITTNLLREQVAGPGTTLHFNFQLFLMIWAVFVALVWMFFAHFVNGKLWILGTRSFGTPRSNCILVFWGYETQQSLMWTKVAFLWIVYLGSFLMCTAYGIYQLRTFQSVDFQHKTMKDFVAMVVGLPAVQGTKDVEEDLKKTIEGFSGVQVVGVSVAWDFKEHEEAVQEAVKEDIEEAELRYRKSCGQMACTDAPELNIVSKFNYKLEQAIFGLAPEEKAEDVEESPEAPGSHPIDEILLSLHTSPRAFVVFQTQEARDEAVEKVGDGFDYEGATGIKLECFEAEPDTVQWQNFGHSTVAEKAMRLVVGFGVIFLACFFWAVVFYSPYAYYVMTFNYENGRQPGFIVGFAFSMIVVVGNAIMYEVCAQISDRVGFRFKDEREACYMVLYTIACMFNVGLDFVTTYFTAEKIMEGLGFRTYFGVPLQEVTEFTAKFETYGMQRSLAENTYGYAFPSTYLIPFLIEPFPTIIAPLLLGRLLVRTHPEVQGKAAAEWVAMCPMEMGRYADLLLNAILGILIFYFPGGYTWRLFLAMAACHMWIYSFDHFRVLRAIPACTFASYDIEFAAQAILAPIIGIIAACLVFKSNCEPGMHCLTGPPLVGICTLGWLVHTVIHLAVLNYVIPMFGKAQPEEDPAKDETFTTLSSRMPCSWFTANPVHCLRSKHKYKHSPPCSFFVVGKEQYMKTNEKIGCHFEESSK
mmetsp:Transcript_163213/g.518641  ORF Transcript_163213/g.518641 Transcript_163213/m.518641 type:complete len:948 (-) Transcript_163213:99-2942(-)